MKRRAHIVGVLLIACAVSVVPAISGERGDVPARITTRMEQACVLVKAYGKSVERGGQGIYVAPGADSGAYILIPTSLLDARGDQAKIFSVVFFPGTEQEVETPATLVTSDTEGGIAYLFARDRPPRAEPLPVTAGRGVELDPTETLYGGGYLWGRQLGALDGNPTFGAGEFRVATSPGTPEGTTSVVPAEGPLLGGGGGGGEGMPIVSRRGELLGIIQYSSGDRRPSPMISADRITHSMEGKLGEPLAWEQVCYEEGILTLRASLPLIDPLAAIDQVAMLIVRASVDQPERLAPRHEGSWGQHSRDMRAFELSITDGIAQGEVTFEQKVGENALYLYQIRYSRGRGRPIHTEPAWQRINLPRAFQRSEPPSASGPSCPCGQVVDVPSVTGAPLLGEAQRISDASVRPVTVAGEPLLPVMLWSPDARFVYLFDQGGCVRKISVPEFVEERHVHLRDKCDSAALSSEGILVVSRGGQTLTLLDPADLTVKLRLHVSGIHHVAASSALAVAYAPLQGCERMAVVDLSQRPPVVRVLSAPKFGEEHDVDLQSRGQTRGRFRLWGVTRVTPDGRFLLCASDHQIHRFSIEGGALTHQESGPDVLDWDTGLVSCSPDAVYVAVAPCRWGEHLTGHPRAIEGSSYVYRIVSLAEPVLILENPDGVGCVMFDQVSRRLYAFANGDRLVSYGIDGARQKEYALPADDTYSTWCGLVHPQGGRLLVQDGSTVLWVEIGR